MARSVAPEQAFECSANLAIDLPLVPVGHLEPNADDLCLRRPLLVGKQAIDDPVARVYVALLVEVELATVGEVPGAEGKAAWLSQSRILLRDFAEQFKRPTLQFPGRKIEKLLLGGGVEEFDREPRHLQTELRRIKACLASHIGQLYSLAGVLRNGLANLLRRHQLVQNFRLPLVSLVGQDDALRLAMRAEYNRVCLSARFAKELQIAREMISRLGTGHDALRRSCHVVRI